MSSMAFPIAIGISPEQAPCRPRRRRSPTSSVKREAVVDAEPEATYPRLLSAQGRCPPEDVGGTWGYAQYLEAMADPKHDRHAEMVDWRGPDFDPNTVDEANIRKALLSFAKRSQRKLKNTSGS